jgi:hypothetical protein
VDGGRNPAEPDCSGAAAGISSAGGATNTGDSTAELISSAGFNFVFFVGTLAINIFYELNFQIGSGSIASGVNGRKRYPHWTPGDWIGSKWNDYRRSELDFLKSTGGNLAVSSGTRWRTLASVSSGLLVKF